MTIWMKYHPLLAETSAQFHDKEHRFSMTVMLFISLIPLVWVGDAALTWKGDLET
jgi:hypothetical protein